MRSKPLSIPSTRSWSSCRGSEALIHVLVGCALAALASSARAEERLALVIGVAEYDSVTTLENPVNDAVAVSDVLGQLGFDVTLGIDVDRETMLAHVETFAEKAQSADVTLFYFAGHGFQIDGENYLIPADAAYRARADLAEQSVTLGRITGLLDGGDASHLVILDACRNNPFEELLGADERRAEDGLARVENAAGFLFAFATQPGQLAWDGEGRPNSYFTGALLNHMQVTGQDIGSALISVRRDVIKATGGEQVPWQTSSLTEQFYFRPGEPEVSPEAMLWRTAAQAQDMALLGVYLDQYPTGTHAEDARQLLDGFTGGLDADHAPRSVASTGTEEELWRVTSRLRSVELARLYLERFPSGWHFEEAERLVDLRLAADESAGADAAICERLATHPGMPRPTCRAFPSIGSRTTPRPRSPPAPAPPRASRSCRTSWASWPARSTRQGRPQRPCKTFAPPRPRTISGRSSASPCSTGPGRSCPETPGVPWISGSEPPREDTVRAPSTSPRPRSDGRPTRPIMTGSCRFCGRQRPKDGGKPPTTSAPSRCRGRAATSTTPWPISSAQSSWATTEATMLWPCCKTAGRAPLSIGRRRPTSCCAARPWTTAKSSRGLVSN